jgi:hypothetical protein
MLIAFVRFHQKSNMAPTQEIVQQPQAQESMTEPQANAVISQQPVC